MANGSNKNSYSSYNSRINNYYTNTSSAYEVSAEAAPSYSPERIRRTENVKDKQYYKHRSKMIKERSKPAYEFVIEKNNSVPVLNYLTAFVVFAGVMTLLTIMSLSASIKYDINFLNEDHKKARLNNEALQSSIYANLDLEKIEKKAIAVLGMQKPEDYQIVYISVPKQNYVVQYEAVETVEPAVNLGMLQSLLLGE